jgi:cell division protein FtsW (lipid II flippase)
MAAARQARTDRTRLLGFCLTTLLAFQAVWICGAMVRAFPFSGINLPFISTGQSSAIATGIAVAAILLVFNAVVVNATARAARTRRERGGL